MRFKFFHTCLSIFLIQYLLKYAKTATSWSNGYYLSSGSWLKWNSSWLTWTNGTAWVTWSPSMFLNSTSSLWQLCSSGMFYSAPLNQCLNWGSSWLNAWAYQSTCFDCTTGQYYDLTAQTCVANWNGSTQIAITDSQFGSKPIWRSFDYYVDSSSLEIIELGTKKYPYKSISLVFVELL